MLQRLFLLTRLALIALVLFAPVNRARADAGEAGLHTAIDGYSVELAFPDGAPTAGPNAVLVHLHDAGGQPLSNAVVQVAAVAEHDTSISQHSHGDSGHDGAAAGEHDSAPDQPGAHADDAAAPHTGAAHIDTIMTQMAPGPAAGDYASVLHFDSAGAWQVQIQFTAGGASHAGSIAVAVAEPPRDWRILGAFGGTNALIIMAAGILKRRSAVTQKHRRAAAPNS